MASDTRVVITGMGLVCPLGAGVETTWRRLLDRQSGIRRLPEEVVPDVAAKIAGVVPSRQEDAQGGFDPEDAAPAKDQKKMDRFIQFALAAADEAISQANWRPQTPHQQMRTATVIASGIGGFPVIAEAFRTTDRRGARRLSPFTVPAFLANLAAGWVSIRYGFKGVIGTPVTACAASVQAIGDAARLLRAGEADVVVAGGAEACIDRVSLGSFAAARALSTGFNETPEAASRPFDSSRDGFVMGEGAGVLVLERLEHAEARGARPLAEVVGYGSCADAYHLTAAPEDGEGAQRAMRLALAQAGVTAGEVGHLNAHATSTPVGDRGELATIKSVFGMGAGPAITSTKSATGHLLGAAGALEAIFAALALRDQIAPATLNLDDPDPEAAGLDLVAGSPRRLETAYALSNGFGFGGVNASVLLKASR